MTPREFDAVRMQYEAVMDWQALLSAQTPHALACIHSQPGAASPGMEEFSLIRAASARQRRQETEIAQAFG